MDIDGRLVEIIAYGSVTGGVSRECYWSVRSKRVNYTHNEKIKRSSQS